MIRTALRKLSRNFTHLQITRLHPKCNHQVIFLSRYLATTPPKCLHFEEPQPGTETSVVSELEDIRLQPFLEKEPKEGVLSKENAIQLLSDELLLCPRAGERIFEKEQRLKYINGANFRRVVELLQKYEISTKSLEEFPWILAMQSDNLRQKLETVTQMNPKSLEDFIPLLRVSHFRLLKILCIMEDESTLIPDGNRIYFIANKLNLPPQLVCKYVSMRLFMLEMPVETLVGNLNAMLDYGVAPLSIIRDLWVFRYNTKLIKERLDRAKRAQKIKLMPWMVRCPESILQRSLKLSLDAKKILGKDDVYDYLSQRLGYDIETTKSIVAKHPVVAKVRVTKIKEILDFLLDEAGFTRYDVANVPRILSHSLSTTKRRLDELKSLGCVPSTLVILCRSQREYDKFLNKWTETRNKIKRKKL